MRLNGNLIISILESSSLSHSSSFLLLCVYGFTSYAFETDRMGGESSSGIVRVKVYLDLQCYVSSFIIFSSAIELASIFLFTIYLFSLFRSFSFRLMLLLTAACLLSSL